MTRLTAPLLVLLLLLTGCGTSDSDYHAAMNKACSDVRDWNQRLPQKMRDEGLDSEQASKLAQERGEKFLKTLEDTEVPGDRQDAHAALIDLLKSLEDESFDTADKAAAFYSKTAKAYDATGSTTCADIARESAKLVTQNPPAGD